MFHGINWKPQKIFKSSSQSATVHGKTVQILWFAACISPSLSILYQVHPVPSGNCMSMYIYINYIYIPTIPPSQTKIVIQNERCRDVSATPGSPFRRPRLGSRRTMARSDAPNRSSHPSPPETARIDASHGHFLSPERSVKIDLWQMLIT